MEINGKTLDDLGLTLLEGGMNELLKPAEPKPAVYNENDGIHGSLFVPMPRYLKRRDFKLSFLKSCASQEETLQESVSELISLFTNGVIDKNNNPTYVNEITLDDDARIFRAVFNRVDTYTGFGKNKAVLIMSFTEYNPHNRQPITV